MRFLLLVIAFLPMGAVGAPLEVIFNEVAWMGNSSNDEWIELYNNTDFDIDLNGWKIVSDDGTPDIILAGIISERGFYLLERTDDRTIPGISANQIYTGALGNNGENLKLSNKDGVLIDEINAKAGWPAGDNSTKQTMARTGPETWATSQETHGTPGRKNDINPAETPALPEPTATALAKPIKGIIFNEILPSPAGPDENEEWVEIYNQNNFNVDLSGWQIKDSFGQTETYFFPDGRVIGSDSYLVIRRPDSKIVLNNREDELLMINPDQETIDSVHYTKAVLGQSFARFGGNSWGWTDKPTPAGYNGQDARYIEYPAHYNINAEKENDFSEKQGEIPVSAGVSRGSFEKTEDNNPWPLKALTTALVVAALSGIAILMLKRLIES